MIQYNFMNQGLNYNFMQNQYQSLIDNTQLIQLLELGNQDFRFGMQDNNNVVALLSQKYCSQLQYFTRPSISQFKNTLIGFLKSNGITYNKHSFKEILITNLVESSKSGNAIKFQAHYGHFSIILTVLNTNQESELKYQGQASKGVHRVKSKLLSYSSEQKLVCVRYKYKSSYFKQAFYSIVKQYLLTKIANIILLQNKYHRCQKFDVIIVHSNQIRCFYRQKNQTKRKQKSQKTQDSIKYLLSLHLLNIVHQNINPTTLSFTEQNKSVCLIDFQKAKLIKMSNQAKRTQINPYLKDFADYLTIDLWKEQPQSETAIMEQREFFDQFNENKSLAILKFYLFSIFTQYALIIDLLKICSDSLIQRLFVRHQIMKFVEDLDLNKQKLCSVILNYFKIQKPQCQMSQNSPKYTQNAQYRFYVSQLQEQKIRSKQENEQKMKLLQKEALIIELSRYLVFTSNQFSFNERQSAISFLMQRLNYRQNSSNFIKQSLKAVLQWASSFPLTFTKLLVFERIVLQGIIFEVQPQKVIIERACKIIEYQEKTLIKFKIIMRILHGVVWVRKKINETSFDFYTLKQEAIALFNYLLNRPQIKINISPQLFKFLQDFIQLLSIKQAQYMASAFFKLVIYLHRTKIQSEKQNINQELQVQASIKQYVFSFLFLQISQTHQIDQHLKSNHINCITQILLEKVSQKRYIQFEYFHFILFSLQMNIGYKQNAFAIYWVFASMFENVLPVKNYQIHLQYQIRNILYQMPHNNKKSALNSLIMLEDKTINVEQFYKLMKICSKRKDILIKFASLYQSDYEIFWPTLSPELISLTQTSSKNQDLWAINLNFNAFVFYFYIVVTPLFCPEKQNKIDKMPCSTQTYTILSAFLSKMQSEVKKLKNVKSKIKYLWILNLEKIRDSFLTCYHAQYDFFERICSIVSFLSFTIKDFIAQTYFSFLIYAIYNMLYPMDIIPFLEFYIPQLMRMKARFNSFDIQQLEYYLYVQLACKDAFKIAELIVSMSQCLQFLQKDEEYVLKIVSVFEFSFALQRKKKEDLEWNAFLEDIYYFIDQYGKTIRPSFHFILLKNASKGSFLVKKCFYLIAKNLQKMPKQQKSFIMPKYFSVYLKQYQPRIRKIRFIQKIDLKTNLKIDTIKKVAKKLLMNTNKKSNILSKVDLNCSGLFHYIQKLSQNLEILI